ncbi:hypothetical protein L209DRAFT_748615 [Thermothelomyces heterothallicus CBS 203.75]
MIHQSLCDTKLMQHPAGATQTHILGLFVFSKPLPLFFPSFLPWEGFFPWLVLRPVSAQRAWVMRMMKDSDD